MSRPRAPAAVVFDLGGVVLHWQPRQLLAELVPGATGDAELVESAFEAVFQGFRAGSDWAEFDRGSLDSEGIVARIVRRSGMDAALVRRIVDAVPGHLVPQAATVALIERLHAAGRPLYFLSNMPKPYAEHLEANLGFLRCFRGGLFSAALRMVKPEAAIFRHAEASFGHEPGDLLFIDDHEANVEAARSLGWQALHFRDPAQCEAALRAQGLLAD